MVSIDFASRICKRLKLPDEVKNPLLLSIADPKQSGNPTPHFHVLAEDEMEFMDDWAAYAVLCAVELPSLHATGENIATYLGIDRTRTQELLDLFVKIGVLKRDGEAYTITGKHLTTVDGKGSARNKGLIDSHRQWIDLALNALQRNKMRSDFSGITQAIPSSKLGEVRRRIMEFRRSLAAYLSEVEEPDDAIYRLNIQFFPVGSPSESGCQKIPGQEPSHDR